jgi:NADPH-dependent 2,4-dienoyl-CoA reductase/sulfur reductase-like enzyme
VVKTYDIAVIGGGPAGLAAADAAANLGVTVAVVDERPQLGGQIFRRHSPSLDGVDEGTALSRWRAPRGYGWAPELLQRVIGNPRITAYTQHTVFGVFPPEYGAAGDGETGGGGTGDGEIDDDSDDTDSGTDAQACFRIAVYSGRTSRIIRARQIILATGAFDMPTPLPGWTLPGVLTAGAAQSFVKEQAVLPGQRFVLAGNHPLLLVAAAQIHRAGGKVREVAFSRGLPSVREAIVGAAATVGHFGMMWELATSTVALLASGTRFRLRTLPVAAEGEDHVNAVRLAARNADGSVRRARRVEADTLVLGYGFQPSIELAKSIGCSLQWDSPAGGWVVAHNDQQLSSFPGVYVAGEPTGVGGAEESRAEGVLAGICAAAAGTAADPDPRLLAAARKQLKKARRFATAVRTLFAPDRAALLSLANTDTSVCRCELVTRGDLEETLHAHPHIATVNATKLVCRSGMGVCQGRSCESAVAGIVAARRGMQQPDAGYFSGQIPAKPVPIDAFVALDEG